MYYTLFINVKVYKIYDKNTVTGQKVPLELDETLEAEYNSLLDET